MSHFVDTHCHLDYSSFSDDRRDVILRASDSGVFRIMNPGTDLESSQRAVDLANQYNSIWAGVGVHPNDALTWDSATADRLFDLTDHPKVRAIGEIGLDYHHQIAPVELQKEIFLAQLDIAQKTGLPVIIHSREALSDTIEILARWYLRLVEMDSPLVKNPGVLHSFEGNVEEARKVIDIHFLIGLAGPVTFKNAVDKRTIATELPLEVLLSETDAPFLTPHPFRGRRNEPVHVKLVAEKIAELRNQPISTVADVLFQNAARLFAWSL